MKDESSLSLSTAEEVDRLCDRFERAWKTGRPLRIGEVLSEQAEPVRAKLFQELLVLDLDYRQRQGDTPTTTEYLRSFPEYETVITAVFREAGSSASGNSATSSAKGGQGNNSVTLQRPRHANEQLAAGSFLGRYEIVKLLGRGAFGTVYRARDAELGRDVALKVPHHWSFAHENEARQFLNEARAAAALKHPAIVTVYDVCRLDDGRCFVVMEYVPGRPLSELLKSDRVSQEQAVQWIAAVAEAVHFAHRQGLFHRDLKPANILIDPEDNPHVCDFGLALHESRQRASAGQFAGTPSYMAPEQVRGEAHRLDGRADIWALGVVLYELLTGRRPFQGETFDELVEEILYRDPKPPRQIDETIGDELQRICLKCLARTATERYASAYDLARDLRRHSRPRRKMSRVLLYASAAILVVCLLVIITYVINRHSSTAPPPDVVGSPRGPETPADEVNDQDSVQQTLTAKEEQSAIGVGAWEDSQTAAASPQSRLVPLTETGKARAHKLPLDEFNEGEYDGGYINFTSDVDVYRLDPNESGKVEIRVIPDWRRGFGLEPVVSVYGGSDQEASHSTNDLRDYDGSLHPQGVVEFTFPLHSGDVYYLAIAGKDQASAGRYKLSLRRSE